MLKDHNHDIIHSLSEKSDAVWRYKKDYLKSSEGCSFCTEMWQKLLEDDEKHIEMLKKELARHMQEERFD